jgi:hypothetical protein
LEELVPPDLRVVRSRAWPARWCRRLGFGDLGLRALHGLHATCSALLRRERFDALFITIYPTYPALLGPFLKRRFGVPFVIDYQDPWVGAWGASVGSRRDGGPDLKSRLARVIARRLEPYAVRAADAITAVSSAIYEELRCRYPQAESIMCVAIPVGGEPADLERIRRQPEPNPHFDPKDGRIHVCYVGTLLPLGFETLRAVLRALALLRDRRPDVYERLRVHFFGTSNQTAADSPTRVLPMAAELGVDDIVREVAPRVDYLSALTLQTQATVLLMMGSSEPHYTASKLYPGLLAERPILAVYHNASSVVDVVNRIAYPSSVQLITYGDTERADSRVEEICHALLSLCEHPACKSAAVGIRMLDEFSAEVLAGRLAAVLEHVQKRR